MSKILFVFKIYIFAVKYKILIGIQKYFQILTNNLSNVPGKIETIFKWAGLVKELKCYLLDQNKLI